MAEVLGIVGSIAGLITLAASTSSLLTGISSTQTRRLVASLDDLMPVLRCILHTLGSQQYHPHPQAPEIQLLAAPVVSLYAVLHRLDGVLQNPGHWWERRERRELVDILVDEIERAKTTMILAFGLVNWCVLVSLSPMFGVGMGCLARPLTSFVQACVRSFEGGCGGGAGRAATSCWSQYRRCWRKWCADAAGGNEAAGSGGDGGNDDCRNQGCVETSCSTHYDTCS
ncbi:hypothetical protein EDC01DRAFT_109425 [Geopyxis carbonaria]|nr:hypothetical protein EDC01DRAFT_109425 [Geopyxis carbonaria]